jgi:hypothetical protein
VFRKISKKFIFLRQIGDLHQCLSDTLIFDAHARKVRAEIGAVLLLVHADLSGARHIPPFFRTIRSSFEPFRDNFHGL